MAFFNFKLLIFILLLFTSFNRAASQNIDGCGTTHGCFAYPDGCSNENCLFIFKWKDAGDSTDFSLSGNFQGPNVYLAIAFSHDLSMGNDSVVFCYSDNTIRNFFNPSGNISSVPISNPSAGLSNLAVNVTNWFTCSFRRAKAVPGISEYFDLNNQYYVFGAYGQFDLATKLPSKHIKEFGTPVKYDFSKLNNLIEDYAKTLADCGKTTGCYSDPPGCKESNCTYIYKWQNIGDSTKFVIAARLSLNNSYLAIGFSNDQNMGEDSVVICKTTNEVQSYYNHSGNTPSRLVDSSNPTLGLSNPYVKASDWFICSFIRKKTLLGVSNFFDFENKRYFIFGVHGLLNSTTNEPLQHVDRFVSSKAYNFAAYSDSIIDTAKTLSDCGKSVGCFAHPPGCIDKDCKFIYKWQDRTDSVAFTLAGNFKLNNSYLAIGFSNDQKMGDDSVVVCTSDYTAQNYYNEPNAEPKLMNAKTFGITNVNVIIEDWFICYFRRIKKVTDVPNFFDIYNPYYIIAAYGTFDPTTKALSQHIETAVSTMKYDFSVYNATPSSSVSTKDCGITSGCFRVPDGCQDDYCQLIIKWSSKNETIAFSLNGKFQSANAYLAIGFSNDDRMGEDSVIICKSDNTAQNYYNPGRTSNPVLQSSPTNGISDVYLKVDSWFSCSFKRLKSLPTARATTQQFFDLSNTYYILSAWGTYDATSKVPSIHTREFASSQKVDFSAYEDISGNKNTNPKVKTHGCIMIITWMFLASSGILIARYYKFLFPQIKINNVDFWFFIHQPLMFMIPILTIIGFIVILAYLKGEWISSEDKLEFTHSIFGIVTLGLSVLQPFLAIFRCGNDHKLRPLLNYVHRGLGITSFVFAVVAMYLGVIIKDMHLGDIGWGLMVGWTIWVVILPVALEVIDFKASKSKNKYSTENNEPQTNANEVMKKLFMVLHLIVSLSFTVALIVKIANPTEEKY